MTDQEWGRLTRWLSKRGLVLVVPLHGQPYTRFRRPHEPKPVYSEDSHVRAA